ncbi:MAG TPA: transposase, partial [Tepidisphaeraceae bacterium]|nr:transposase [Tepidisphaeraceae bacterium]
VYWLPPYCPSLNLIERLWGHLKRTVLANVLFETLDDLVAAFRLGVGPVPSPLNQSMQTASFELPPTSAGTSLIPPDVPQWESIKGHKNSPCVWILLIMDMLMHRPRVKSPFFLNLASKSFHLWRPLPRLKIHHIV